jgi:hypothetical protein
MLSEFSISANPTVAVFRITDFGSGFGSSYIVLALGSVLKVKP